jgi:hypothetical protein
MSACQLPPLKHHDLPFLKFANDSVMNRSESDVMVLRWPGQSPSVAHATELLITDMTHDDGKHRARATVTRTQPRQPEPSDGRTDSARDSAEAAESRSRTASYQFLVGNSHSVLRRRSRPGSPADACGVRSRRCIRSDGPGQGRTAAGGVAESSNAVVVYFGCMCFNCRVNFCFHTGPFTSNSLIMLIQNLGSPPLQPTGAQNGCA